jgi:hypothetical protein
VSYPFDPLVNIGATAINNVAFNLKAHAPADTMADVKGRGRRFLKGPQRFPHPKMPVDGIIAQTSISSCQEIPDKYSKLR